MPKKTNIPKPSKRKKTGPETAQDWLEHGIELEESGDRWVQTPEKAHRFYLQAITAYETALQLDGQLYDAAYNRAHVILQISQVCALSAQARLTQLQQARSAHLEVLGSYPDKTDVKYNLACTIILFSEELAEHVNDLRVTDAELGADLLRALELLEQCRQSQTEELRILNGPPSDQVSSMSDEPNNDQQEVEVSYITNDILMDTLLSMMDGRVQVISKDAVDRDSSGKVEALLNAVFEQASTLVHLCSKDYQSRLQASTRSILLAQAESAYNETHDFSRWQATLEGVCQDCPTTELACVNADGCIAAASACTDNMTKWKLLSLGAAKQIARATELSTHKSPQIWLTRADIELLRSHVDCDAARKNKTVLMNNAVIYYKRAIADCLPKDILLQQEAALKQVIIEAELSQALPKVPEMSQEVAIQIVRDARADGLLVGEYRVLRG